ncbi:MAG: hypothetical protein B5M53_11815, partial [Candidatus Cloacimonas sp. 4484_209]
MSNLNKTGESAMKHFLIFSIVLICVIFASSLSGQIVFERWYGGSGSDFGRCVAQTTDKGYIVGGYTGSYGAGYTDFYLVRTDSLGDTLWTGTYGGSSWDEAYCCAHTNDKGYIVVGHSESFSGTFDVYVVKTDSSGDTLWTKIFGGMSGNDAGFYVGQTTDKGYIIAGEAFSYNSGDVYLIKTDSLGDSLWTRHYGGSGIDAGNDAARTADGGYIVVGKTNSYGAGDFDIYIVRTDSLGDTLWTKTYGGINDDVATSVARTTDGGFVIGGWTENFGSGMIDVYLVKSDSLGDTLWTKTYGGTSDDWCTSLAQTNDRGYIITGRTYSFGSGGSDVYLIRTDSLGDTLWTKTYGGGSDDNGYSVKQTLDGGYIIGGETQSFGAGGYDVYLIKTDGAGNSGIEERQDLRYKTEDLRLYIYPNPFTANTVIRLQVSGARGKTNIYNQTPITLYIHDVSGRLVKRLSIDGLRLTSAIWDKDSSNFCEFCGYDLAQYRKSIQQGISNISESDIEKAYGRTEEVVKQATKLAKKGGPFDAFLKRIKILVSLLKDYKSKKYREVPWRVIAAVVFAILYFINPFDIIPDFIPGIGY